MRNILLALGMAALFLGILGCSPQSVVSDTPSSSSQQKVSSSWQASSKSKDTPLPQSTQHPTPSPSPTPPSPEEQHLPEAEGEKVEILVEGMTFYGEVAQGNAAREFCSMLPMTLGLTDREGTAKVFDLPSAFTQEEETISNVSAGTLGLEGSGRLCLYYADGSSDEGLVPLVVLGDPSGLDQALQGDIVEVTIQLANP